MLPVLQLGQLEARVDHLAQRIARYTWMLVDRTAEAPVSGRHAHSGVPAAEGVQPLGLAEDVRQVIDRIIGIVFAVAIVAGGVLVRVLT